MTYIIMGFHYKGGTMINIYNNQTRQLSLRLNFPKPIFVVQKEPLGSTNE